MIIVPSGFGGLIAKNCSAKQVHGEGRLRPLPISKFFALDNAKVLNFTAQNLGGDLGDNAI